MKRKVQKLEQDLKVKDCQIDFLLQNKDQNVPKITSEEKEEQINANSDSHTCQNVRALD